MLKKDDVANIINGVKGKLDETQQALISEDLLNLQSSYINDIDEHDKLQSDYNNLSNEKEELLKVNGRLYQKIGYEKIEEPKPTITPQNETSKYSINDIINEKGELI